MEENGILPSEFKMVGNSVRDQISTYIFDLENLNESLENAEEFFEYEKLAFYAEVLSDTYEIMQSFYFYLYVNYFFCTWDDEESLAALENNIIDKIEFLIPEEYEWQSDSGDVEEIVETLLDDYEEVIERKVDYLGKLNEKLMEEQRGAEKSASKK